MQKIIPHLWFDRQAEEAAKFYTSVFRNGKIGDMTRYTEAGFEVHKMPAGTVLTVEFEIEGYKFIGLNGGPIFKFTPAISFMVNCSSKGEVDALYQKLAEGGKDLMPLDAYPFAERYAWVADKFGLTWQLIFRKENMAQDRIVPSLLFTGEVSGKAEEALKHYVSIFKNSKMGQVSRYQNDTGVQKKGDLMFGDCEIERQKLAAMDGGNVHNFTFNEAVSLLVLCGDQKEVDYFWERLNRNPEEGQCGWLHDAYGVSWQIAPEGMSEMLNSSDREASDRAMNAMLSMKKIDISALKKAFEGK